MSRYGLELPGWHDSAWGYDESLGSWFAQLYQDHQPVADEDTPHVWLSGIDFTYHTKDQLAAGIAEATGLRVRKIRKAMAASEPYPVG
jgi:hypothetical protein